MPKVMHYGMFMPNVELDLMPNAVMLLRRTAYDSSYWVAEYV